MRLGIACFSRKKYQQAIPHFRKALEYSKGDVVALRYLYYSYLYSGRDADRHALMHHMPVNLREEIMTGKIKGITGVEISATYFNNTDQENAGDYDPSQLPGQNGYQSFVNHGGSGSALFTSQPGENVSVNYGYRFLSKNRFLFLHNDDGEYTLPDNSFTQHQLYVNFNFRPADGWLISFSFNYLNLRTVIPTSAYGNREFLVTASSGDVTSYIMVRKDLPCFSFYGGFGLSGMNNFTQMQTDGGVVVYPFGNLNLYLGTGITYLMEGDLTGDIRQEEDIIWSPFLGFRIAGTLWGELFATTGNLSNYQSEKGWILYNEDNPRPARRRLNMPHSCWGFASRMCAFPSFRFRMRRKRPSNPQ
jgi:tetratricopeptide (TPR) repeat protein